MKNEALNLKNLLAVTMADIDIFLLRNEDQTADNDKKSFTREEIRNQLLTTMQKSCKALTKAGYNIEKPLHYK